MFTPFRLRPASLFASLFLASLVANTSCGQQGIGQQGFGQQGNGPGNQIGQGNQGGQGNQNIFGGISGTGQGGSQNADFDSLIDLIQSTVEADTWMENGTGDGEVQPFPTGVYISSAGALAFSEAPSSAKEFSPTDLNSTDHQTGDARQSSKLRFVSLPKLEQAIWQRQLEHQPLSSEMLTLAGLERIEHVLVAPDSGDLILAGPAGDWQIQENGRIVSVQTGQPVVRLDDLLTLWRRPQQQRAESFGCSIIPRQQALAATQSYLDRSSQEPLEPSDRGKWLEGLQKTLGQQDVVFFGMEAESHVARVLLMADYHMKLIGMGIAEGVDGVESYLSSVQLMPDGSAPPMSVLRWWFAMNYVPVQVNVERTTYRLQGQGVKVLSENELLAAQGRRVHTGKSDDLNLQFANSFTKHFSTLSQAYPLYGELRNVFDLELALSIVRREGLMERIGWGAELFSSDDALRLPKLSVPTEVETVVNHRVINRRHIIAGISGGVWLDAAKSAPIVAAKNVTSENSILKDAPAPKSEEIVWWWD